MIQKLVHSHWQSVALQNKSTSPISNWTCLPFNRFFGNHCRPKAMNIFQAKPTVFLSIALLAACASSSRLQPFSTDGCSLFPDRALIGKSDWCECCVAHDLVYWRGGTSEERLKADRDLKACVYKVSGNEPLAELMFAGVRSGGGHYFYTPYRWGYGWQYGRSYGPLSIDEQALAASLEREYLAKGHPLSCPSKPKSVE